MRTALRENKPYDAFVRELLTSSGSNFRVPPVNFYRAIQGHEPAAIAEAVALTWMGTRFEHWPEAQRDGMAAFFSRIAYKPTAEWKEEIVCLDPAPADALEAVFPGGVAVTIPPATDPRQVFADWLITDDNPWFARNIVNRIWAWLLGRGIIHEPDDLRPDNPPVNPELLAYLEKELATAHYDLRHLYRLILNSSTYQQSSIPQTDQPDAESLFAQYAVRRLDAEVLIDALTAIFGGGEGYSSPIPEPFTFIPDTQRTIALADGSITSAFLEMFGRPARDTGYESERNNQPTDAQRLHLAQFFPCSAPDPAERPPPPTASEQQGQTPLRRPRPLPQHPLPSPPRHRGRRGPRLCPIQRPPPPTSRRRPRLGTRQHQRVPLPPLSRLPRSGRTPHPRKTADPSDPTHPTDPPPPIHSVTDKLARCLDCRPATP